MAAGDRYKNGKPKDIVKHMSTGVDSVLCGIKNAGYSSTSWNEVTCLRCLLAKQKSDSITSINPNNWASQVTTQ